VKPVRAITGLAAIAAGIGGAVTAYHEPQAHAAVAAREPGLCAAPEHVVYSCRFPRGIGSVCRGTNTLHYRFGQPGHVGIDIASAPDWHNIHTGGVVGGGHGSEDHIRFTAGPGRNPVHYIVFAGEMGDLTDHPGRHYSGIAIVRDADGRKTLATLDCKSHAQIAHDGLTGALSGLKPGPDDEVQDGPFDAWY
jgi:hypothetical protein